MLAGLFALNRTGVRMLLPYLMLGAVLWLLVLISGVHATVAGAALAMTIPIVPAVGGDSEFSVDSPLHRLEHALAKVVPFVIIPIFGFPMRPCRVLFRLL